MNYTSIEQFIADLPALAEAAREQLKGVSGCFRLEIKQGRSFNICLEDGHVTLPQAVSGDYDCVVTADEGTIMDLLGGRLNPVKALLTRRVSVKGDMAKLLSLAKLAR